MTLARWLRGLAAAVVGVGSAHAEAPAPTQTVEVRIFADTDDDDRDGLPDRDAATPADAADVLWFEGVAGGLLSVRSVTGGGLRVIAGTNVLTGGVARATRIGLQGLAPGEATVVLGDRVIHARVCGVHAEAHDGGWLDLATDHASLSRTLPPGLAEAAGDPPDEDALRWVTVCPAGALPTGGTLTSFRADGRELDTVPLAVQTTPCPPGVGQGRECGVTARVRASVDVVDRSHPSSVDASVLAEVGGRLALSFEGRKAASIRVGGPRRSAIGPIERFRGRLVFHVVRMWPGGDPPIGGNDGGARSTVLRETRTLDSIWGQCGVVFSPLGPEDVRVVDPPPPHMLAFGCDLATPASGGRVVFSVDGERVEVATRPRETPAEVARHAAAHLRALGYSAVESANARTASAAYRTVDVLIRREDGTIPPLAMADEPLSDDPTLPVCLGEVDLSDGLDHFGDLDAAAGTVEERTLIKGLQDGDPSTVDVFVIGSFSRTGRIGESFIDADRSSIQNAVVIDRAGIRAGARSYALAHELGHILLDMPGHPDDFGVDRPWLLMDADAADPTIFGPRRLPVAECVRALRQSGPPAPVPLLRAWPMAGAGQAGGLSAERSP